MEEIEKNYARTGSGQNDGCLRCLLRVIKGALDALQVFHSSGYLHLDISPDNILLIGRGDRERVILIDYNSVYTLEEAVKSQGFRISTKEGYSAPEVQMGQADRIGPWTDLFSLTAVFYQCLTGTVPSQMQLLGLVTPLPDFSEISMLAGCPETVLSQLKRILVKGLAAPPKRRYPTAEKMREDLAELEERLTGRGITHWALWESGRPE